MPEGGRLDLAALFGVSPKALWIEVGFGDGEHLAAQAEAHPDIAMIGCEPYLNGVAKLLRRVADRGLGMVRVYRDDARRLIESLPDSSVDRVFVLFPDPWPKKRHRRRRFICAATLHELARVVKPGGEIRAATDDPGCLLWLLAQFQRAPQFAWLARRPIDWQARPEGAPATRYETKALAAGARCTYLHYRRRGP